MEHAAQACVQVLEDEKVDLSHVCVACGSGNNGGTVSQLPAFYKITDTP